MPWHLAAIAWGFAEATVFFLVPDVLLTFTAIRFGMKTAFALSATAAIGAVAGGAVMIAAAGHHAAAVTAILDAIPAISPGMIAETRAEMIENWPFAVFIGAVTGVPFKIFAVQSAVLQIAEEAFLSVAFAARLARFVLAVLLARIAIAGLKRAGMEHRAAPAWFGFWCLFYVFYFSTMPN
ncbi:hypothetical protein HPQ64_18050 [Rhizobiales bacterium]|uniref:hypothetical protein n=1 Tax=Hongsoonwoonella zoysiae TaxID=2821844 RepID=UPI001560542F|nr:hypothetical protein [Hongsoonwoonella zoysiae]NRG19597.1 hypothetical protein [Hongsoonwoonella zoysiae]